MKIKFTDVGRDKWNGEMEIEDTTNLNLMLDTIEAFLKKKNILATKFPETEYVTDTNEGLIYSGNYCVGYFEVVK